MACLSCFGWNGDHETRSNTGFFQRSSPALQQILLQIYSGQGSKEIDHRLYGFGSVEYHIQSPAADPGYTYLSISTPILNPGNSDTNQLCSSYTIHKIEQIHPNAIEILEQARSGYQLTLRLNITRIPQGKDGVKVIEKIAALESVILSSQLKERLNSFPLETVSEGSYRPVKLMYRPKEPFFVILEEQKITVIFPMRFKETSDVGIATSFFQELMEVGDTNKALAKAPACTWSPIPPPDLRGELIEDLSTKGGFVSFDILPRHIVDKRLDRTLWNLLNFYTYVKSHIKSTKGFIQRKLRGRLDDLVKVLHKPNISEDEDDQKVKGCGWKMNPIRSSRVAKLRKRFNHSNIKKKVKRIGCSIKIHGFSELNRKIKRIHHRIKIHCQCFSIPKLHSAKGYTRLE